jgi:hypothetical protein
MYKYITITVFRSRESVLVKKEAGTGQRSRARLREDCRQTSQ